MSIQVTVRLPDEEVAFIDELVAGGTVPSRAAAVTAALRRERRRQVALRDVTILAAGDEDPDDLDGLTAHAARTPLDLD